MSERRRTTPVLGMAELRQEYEREGVGTALYDLINRVVTRGVTRYPVSVYAPDGASSWTPDARAAVAHEWALERLLGPRRSLERMLDQASSTEQLVRLLHRSLKDHLRDSLSPDSSRRIRQRTLDVLRDDPAYTCVSGYQRRDDGLWSFEGATGNASPRRLLQRVAWSCSDDELSLLEEHGPEHRQSPLIRTVGLQTLVRRLFAETAGVAFGGDLAAVVCRRLGLPDPALVPASLSAHEWIADALADPSAGIEAVLEEHELQAWARGVLAELAASDRERLHAYFTSDENESEAGRSLGVNRRTIWRSRQALHRNIASVADDAGTAIAVHRFVVAELLATTHPGTQGRKGGSQ